MVDKVIDALIELDIHEFKGTVKEYDSFSAEKDAAVLRKAMKGLGTDEKAIIEVTANRTNKQRQLIKEQFKQAFGRDLLKDLASELGGHFKDLVLALYHTHAQYDASLLHKAMKGAGTKEGVLIEILVSRTNKEMKEIREAYKKMYKTELEKDIKGDTSGDFEHLLVSLCQGNRSEDEEIHEDLAKKEAEALYQAGEKKMGTNEEVFNRVFCVTSLRQLRAVFIEYKKIAKKDIVKTIEGEFSGDAQAGYKALALVAKYRPAYFAKQLHKSMKGAGTNDAQLIRIMATRSEIDMQQIEQAFHKMYQKKLSEFIKGDTSGDYEKLLLALLH